VFGGLRPDIDVSTLGVLMTQPFDRLFNLGFSAYRPEKVQFTGQQLKTPGKM
jgi:hypothetical protein